MNAFDQLCPVPPAWDLDWGAVLEAFPWLHRLDAVTQDPAHHGEGDVLIHTRLTAEALVSLPQWRARPRAERARLLAAALLHDIAKPDCTRQDADGRITAHGHSRRGDLLTRRILWQAGVPIAWREHVCALVRHHQIDRRLPRARRTGLRRGTTRRSALP
jgi:hypothetical protein